MYSLGPEEQYVVITMPFGKSNSSSKLLCRWASVWFDSCVHRFNQKLGKSAVLGSYVDDAFVGARTRKIAKQLITFITTMGSEPKAEVNPAKTEGSSTFWVILIALLLAIQGVTPGTREGNETRCANK